MSQKTSKRARKATEDELELEFKTPDATKSKDEPVKNIGDEIDTTANNANGVKEPSPEKNSKAETANDEHQTPSPVRIIQTRSRFNSPQTKLPDNAKSDLTNGSKDETNSPAETNKDTDVVKDEANKVPDDEVAHENTTNGLDSATENGSSGIEVKLSQSYSEDMEPLVLEKEEEEPILELQFDENDLDLESEGSPSRCKTRRSQTRNISTPKTPKTLGEQEIESKVSISLDLPDDKSESSTPKKKTHSSTNDSLPEDTVDLDTSDTYSSVSTDNISTRAVAGSDATRNTDLTYQDSGLFEENSYSTSPNRSLGETLRNLSSRRTIRPISEDYRRFALRNTLDFKGNNSFGDYESVQKISFGTKRKNRSTSPEETKRFKNDTSGFMSYLSGPICSFKNTFSTGTPKLILYENKNSEFEEEDNGDFRLEVGNKEGEQKKRCIIM